jgi:hypothetical protein
MPQVFLTSSETKRGRTELLSFIAECIGLMETEQAERKVRQVADAAAQPKPSHRWQRAFPATPAVPDEE